MATPPLMRPKRFGHYTLLRKIATGGTADIFLARRHGVDGFARHLAIKRILPHLADDPAFVQLLLDEARLAAHLHHGHIIETHEVGLEGDAAYIAMEYLPGTDVGRLLKRAGARRRRVLIVHPDEAVRIELSAALSTQTLDVLTVADREAAGALRSGAIDLLVIDGALLGPIRDPLLDRLQSRHPELLRTIILGEVEGRGVGAYALTAPEPDVDIVTEMAGQLLRPIMPLELAMQVVRAVADGLDYAHKAADFDGNPLRLVHRDVNPSNVLISVNGMVKIVDFGIARATTARRDDSGNFVGTFRYMSPEQSRGKAVDARSDIFSLGVLLYELVSGVHPFMEPGGESNQFAVMRAIREDDPPLLGDLVPGAPTTLAEIACKAMAKNPDDRYATAGQMVGALEDAVRREGFNLSPRRLEGFMRVVFGPGELEDFGVTGTGTQIRALDPSSIPAPALAPAPETAAPTPAAPTPAAPRPPAEVEIDLSDVQADASQVARRHPLEQAPLARTSRPEDAPHRTNVSSRLFTRGLVAICVIVGLALAGWYLHGQTSAKKTDENPVDGVLTPNHE